MRVHLQNETEEMLVLHGNSEARADVPMFYRHSGQGPPLVWLHWLWGEPGWMPHHQQLAERFHVYAPDLPGYGQSTLPEWAHRPRDVAVLLLRFLDALSLEQPIVVASCLGGWVAAELAILRPERLARLVLISPLGLTQDWTQIPNLFYSDPARLQSYIFAHPDHELADQYIPDVNDWNERFLNNRNACIRLVFDPYLHSRELAHYLHLLTTPTCILWGERDPLLGPEHAVLWASRIPQADSVIIPATGHLPYVENRDTVIQAVHAFVSTQDTQGESA